jgi:uncharacterized membrane protein YkoI
MFRTARKTVVTLAALGALALGGSAIAGAAQSSTATPTQTPAASQGQPPGGGRPAVPHRANGKTEQPLTGDTAAKVKAAALKKVPGGTIERVETDADHGSPYEAHVTKADGTQLEVLVDKSFAVTAVNAMQHP